jgi:hypothetical protein
VRPRGGRAALAGPHRHFRDLNADRRTPAASYLPVSQPDRPKPEPQLLCAEPFRYSLATFRPVTNPETGLANYLNRARPRHSIAVRERSSLVSHALQHMQSPQIPPLRTRSGSRSAFSDSPPELEQSMFHLVPHSNVVFAALKVLSQGRIVESSSSLAGILSCLLVTQLGYPHPRQQCYMKNLRFCDAFGVWGPHSLVEGWKIAGKKFNPMEVNLI